MNKMTITEALSEIKLITKKLERKRRKLQLHAAFQDVGYYSERQLIVCGYGNGYGV
jgi:hypothetical protein